MNITWHRIWAITLRHLRQITHDLDKVSNMLFWPFLEIVLWSFTGAWIQSNQSVQNLGLALVVSAVFWVMVVRVNFDTMYNFMEELLSFNLTNLFATPLTIGEWMASCALMSLIIYVPLTLYCFGLAWLTFGFCIPCIDVQVLAMMLFSCLAAGYLYGFFNSTILVYRGKRAESSTYMLGWLFGFLSGVYYPVDVFPWWLQKVAYLLPTTYAFEAFRAYLLTNVIDYYTFGINLALNAFYLALALIIFKIAFEKSRAKGLARLVD